MSDDYKSFVNELTSRLDLVDVIGSQVSLKKAGKEYHALCPFHGEKTPSFTLSPQKQFYYCFGCHAKGDAITFTMQYFKLTFREAVEKLAHSVGLTPPSHTNAPVIDRDLYKFMRDYTIVCKQDLQESPEALDYLRSRNIPARTQSNFHIGYTGSKAQAFINKNLSTHFEKLQTCGLLSIRDGKPGPKFYKRLLFPIQDTQGRIIAFGGRVLDQDRKPKYLNSPETILFKKRYNLYGLTQFKQNPTSDVFVVEGYMDVVSLASHDITNAVACLGTAFTSQHWKLITRFSDKIVFCFDGDNAGKKAAWQTLLNILPVLKPEKVPFFMFMPDGEDPDTFCQESGKAAFHLLAQQAITWDVFLRNSLSTKHPADSVSSKAAFHDEVEKILATLTHPALVHALRESLLDTTEPLSQQKHPVHTSSSQEQTTNDQATRYIALLSATLSQLFCKDSSAWSPPCLIDNPQHHSSIHAINQCLDLLQTTPETTGSTLRDSLEQDASLAGILSQCTIQHQTFNPKTLSHALYSLCIFILERRIQSSLNQSSTGARSSYDKKLLQSFILEKKKCQDAIYKLIND